LLIGIIGEVADQTKPVPHSAKVDDIGATLTIVDGTLLKALPKTVEALAKDENDNAFKADIRYEIVKAIPVDSELTNGNGNEKTVIELQIYTAIIGCLLIVWYSGRKPSKRTYEMFCWYLSGWADEEGLSAHIERLKKQTVD